MDTKPDRLTMLPEFLIRLIISFLPLIDAIRLCSLSRQLYRLWESSEIIEFDEKYFLKVREQQPLPNFDEALALQKKGKRKFADFVNRTLLLFRNQRISKFSVKFDFRPAYSPCIQAWVSFVLSRNVEELNLDCSDGYPLQMFRSNYQPYFHMNSISLKVLRLNFCNIYELSSKKFPALSSISLTALYITNEYLQLLLNNCPVLEVLSLISCRVERIHFFSSSILRIKRLTISGCAPLSQGIKLFTPGLQYFEYAGSLVNFYIGSLDELMDAKLDFGWGVQEDLFPAKVYFLLQCLNKAEKLTIAIYQGEMSPLGNMFIQFQSPLVNLVHLTLITLMYDCQMPDLLSLLMCSARLESLTIHNEYKTNDYVGSAFPDEQQRDNWEMPVSKFNSLKVIKFEGFSATMAEMVLIKFLLKEAETLERLIITPWPRPRAYAIIISNAVKEIGKLYCKSSEVELIYDEIVSEDAVSA